MNMMQMDLFPCYRKSVAISGLAMFVFAAAFNSVIVAQEISPELESQRQLQLEEQRQDFLREQQDTSKDVRLEGLDEPIDLDILAIPDDETPCFPIETITLVGDSAEKFQWLLSHMGGEDKEQVLNRCLGAKGVNLIMRRMQNKVVEKVL